MELSINLCRNSVDSGEMELVRLRKKYLPMVEKILQKNDFDVSLKKLHEILLKKRLPTQHLESLKHVLCVMEQKLKKTAKKKKSQVKEPLVCESNTCSPNQSEDTPRSLHPVLAVNKKQGTISKDCSQNINSSSKCEDTPRFGSVSTKSFSNSEVTKSNTKESKRNWSLIEVDCDSGTINQSGSFQVPSNRSFTTCTETLAAVSSPIPEFVQYPNPKLYLKHFIHSDERNVNHSTSIRRQSENINQHQAGELVTSSSQNISYQIQAQNQMCLTSLRNTMNTLYTSNELQSVSSNYLSNHNSQFRDVSTKQPHENMYLVKSGFPIQNQANELHSYPNTLEDPRKRSAFYRNLVTPQFKTTHQIQSKESNLLKDPRIVQNSSRSQNNQHSHSVEDSSIPSYIKNDLRTHTHTMSQVMLKNDSYINGNSYSNPYRRSNPNSSETTTQDFDSVNKQFQKSTMIPTLSASEDGCEKTKDTKTSTSKAILPQDESKVTNNLLPRKNLKRNYVARHLTEINIFHPKKLRLTNVCDSATKVNIYENRGVKSSGVKVKDVRGANETTSASFQKKKLTYAREKRTVKSYSVRKKEVVENKTCTTITSSKKQKVIKTCDSLTNQEQENKDERSGVKQRKVIKDKTSVTNSDLKTNEIVVDKNKTMISDALHITKHSNLTNLEAKSEIQKCVGVRNSDDKEEEIVNHESKIGKKIVKHENSISGSYLRESKDCNAYDTAAISKLQGKRHVESCNSKKNILRDENATSVAALRHKTKLPMVSESRSKLKIQADIDVTGSNAKEIIIDGEENKSSIAVSLQKPKRTSHCDMGTKSKIETSTAVRNTKGNTSTSAVDKNKKPLDASLKKQKLTSVCDIVLKPEMKENNVSLKECISKKKRNCTRKEQSKPSKKTNSTKTSVHNKKPCKHNDSFTNTKEVEDSESLKSCDIKTSVKTVNSKSLLSEKPNSSDIEAENSWQQLNKLFSNPLSSEVIKSFFQCVSTLSGNNNNGVKLDSLVSGLQSFDEISSTTISSNNMCSESSVEVKSSSQNNFVHDNSSLHENNSTVTSSVEDSRFGPEMEGANSSVISDSLQSLSPLHSSKGVEFLARETLTEPAVGSVGAPEKGTSVLTETLCSKSQNKNSESVATEDITTMYDLIKRRKVIREKELLQNSNDPNGKRDMKGATDSKIKSQIFKNNSKIKPSSNFTLNSENTNNDVNVEKSNMKVLHTKGLASGDILNQKHDTDLRVKLSQENSSNLTQSRSDVQTVEQSRSDVLTVGQSRSEIFYFNKSTREISCVNQLEHEKPIVNDPIRYTSTVVKHSPDNIPRAKQSTRRKSSVSQLQSEMAAEYLLREGPVVNQSVVTTAVVKQPASNVPSANQLQKEIAAVNPLGEVPVVNQSVVTTAVVKQPASNVPSANQLQKEIPAGNPSNVPYVNQPQSVTSAENPLVEGPVVKQSLVKTVVVKRSSNGPCVNKSQSEMSANNSAMVKEPAGNILVMKTPAVKQPARKTPSLNQSASELTGDNLSLNKKPVVNLLAPATKTHVKKSVKKASSVNQSKSEVPTENLLSELRQNLRKKLIKPCGVKQPQSGTAANILPTIKERFVSQSVMKTPVVDQPAKEIPSVNEPPSEVAADNQSMIKQPFVNQSVKKTPVVKQSARKALAVNQSQGEKPSSSIKEIGTNGSNQPKDDLGSSFPLVIQDVYSMKEKNNTAAIDDWQLFASDWLSKCDFSVDDDDVTVSSTTESSVSDDNALIEAFNEDLESTNRVFTHNDSLILPKFEDSHRAWKSSNAYRLMTTKEALTHFYKCMDRDCIFTTVREKSFTQHLQDHVESYENGGQAQIKDWKLCSYCCLVIDSVEAYLEHLTSEHGDCVVQCFYCFHRSKTVQQAKLHLRDEHAENQPRALYCHKNGTVVDLQKDLQRTSSS